MIAKLPTLGIQKGAKATYEGRLVAIESILDLNLVQVRDLATDKLHEVKIQYLSAPPMDISGDSGVTLSTAKAKEEAADRKTILRALQESGARSREDVGKIAAEFGYHPSTVYRWRTEANDDGEVRRKQRSNAGRSLLGDVMDELIKRALTKLGPLDRTAKSIQRKIEEEIEKATPEEIAKLKLRKRKKSQKAEVLLPSIGCIRRRLRKTESPREKLKRTHGIQAAKQEFDPALGSLPNAEVPFAVWQIDHVLLDIILVDDKDRKDIGRPWLTIAIDPSCRIVPGFDFSIDPPGGMSTGNCLAFSILPKDTFLMEIGCTGDWPVWGMPAAIHGDNAFRLNFLKLLCVEKKWFDLIWRPVKNPRFGGHIERLAKTFGESIHYLPGTTLSDPKARGLYDSKAQARFTESEFRQWLVERILLYHAEKHSALQMSPMKAYHRGVFKGTATHLPVGLQNPIVDPDAQRRLKLELMPYEERTVQRYGVVIDKIHYWNDCLRRWVNAREPDNPKHKRKFRFRTLKRGLKSKWFYDPELDEYYEIPTRDPSFPDISTWDLKKIRAQAKEEGLRDEQVDEAYIKARYQRMRDIEDQAGKSTTATRRTAQRRLGWQSAPRPGPPKSLPAAVEIQEDEVYERVTGFTEDD